MARGKRKGTGSGGGEGSVVPSEEEVVSACEEIKSEHPEFGVKRVFSSLVESRPRWQLTMRRVQRVMRAHSMTVARSGDEAGLPPCGPETSPRAPSCFPEDCVCMARKPHAVGWVLRAAGVLGGEEEDAGSYDEDDEEGPGELAPGEARVQWLDSYEPTVSRTEDLTVLDRPFVAGDVVARRVDSTGPLGTVASVRSTADLKIVYAGPSNSSSSRRSDERGGRSRSQGLGTAASGNQRGRSSGQRVQGGGTIPPPTIPPTGNGSSTSTTTTALTRPKLKSVVKGLDAAGLRPIGGARTGDPVGHARHPKWAGRVVGATYNVTVRASTAQGSVSCVFSGLGDNGARETQLLEPCDDQDYGFDELCPYFPGQRLSGPPSVWRRAQWTGKHQGRPALGRRRRSGLVEKVELDKVGVQWLAFGPGADREPPPSWFDASDLVLMPKFAGSLRVGDYVTATDPQAIAALGGQDVCGQVVRTSTDCVVDWCDKGSQPEDVRSLDLVPRQQLGDHDFLPHDLVVPVEEEDDDDASSHKTPPPPRDELKTGVVLEVDAKNRTVVVRWESAEQKDDQHPSEERETTETLSAYEVALHPSYNLSAGELVLKLAPGAGLVAGSLAAAGDDGAVALLDLPDDVQSAAEARDIATAIRLSLSHALASSSTPSQEQKATPDQGADDDDNTGGGGKKNDDDAPWLGQVVGLVDGSVEVQWLDADAKTRCHPADLIPIPEARSDFGDDDDHGDDAGLDDFETDHSDRSDHSDDDGARADATAQVGSGTGHHPQQRRAETNDATTPPGASSSFVSTPTPTPTSPPVSPPREDKDGVENRDDDESADAGDDGGDAAFAVVDADPPADHHFASSPPQQLPLPVVRKLWGQLSKNLPSGVSARAFSNRSDLLRVVIVGPDDTPYAQLLFVFDLQLPSTYPADPPGVFYHARGVKERLNPNLYENGKVCLSLLGTWSGPGWDPHHSTVLQVLVSLQGLVLVDRPYYNEPGNENHAGTLEGDHQAHLYNESATLLAVKVAVSVLKQPPFPLASVIAAHLRSDAFAGLLDRLRAVVDHHQPDTNQHATSAREENGAADADPGCADDQPQPPSEGFRRVLKRLLPQLQSAVDRFLRLHPPPADNDPA